MTAELDIRSPGFAGHFLRGSHERRQAISAFLAHSETEKLNAANIVELQTSTHDEILMKALDQVPEGLRGFLSRSAKQSHPRSFYHLLVTILREASASERRVLSHHQDIDLDFLERWLIAPPKLRKPAFLSTFKDKDELAEFLAATNVLEEAGLSRAAILSRLSDVISPKCLSVAVRDLLAGLAFKRGPLPGNSVIVAVTSVSELNDAARTLRNCAASHVFDVLDGRSSFYIVRSEGPIGMVHLEREGGDWIINDIVGKSNRPVSRKTADTVFAYFESRGILRGVACRPSQWDAVRRFCRTHHGMM